MDISLTHLYYLGGSTKEVAESEYSSKWNKYREELFFDYPKLFPRKTDVEKSYVNMGDIAWAGWEYSDNRIFVVYFKETRLREFLNFIFLVYEDEDNSKTQALCRLSNEDWVDIKHQLREGKKQINIPDKAKANENTVNELLIAGSPKQGLALRFPRRYKNDTYTGNFEDITTIFPEAHVNSPTPPLPTKDNNIKKKNILLTIILVYTIGLTMFAIGLTMFAIDSAEKNQNLQTEIQELKIQLQKLQVQTRETPPKEI